ncbi:MAG: PorV/PorQ family protein [Candidatus Desantisbacteria bacterium]
MVYVLLILTTLFMCDSPVFAANNTTSASFLKIGAGARATGMGEAFCGLADDMYAMYWNPAGLGQINGSQFGATHLSYLTGINQEQIGFAKRMGTKTAARGATSFGLNISHLMANNFERTDKDGNRICGKFDAANTCLGLSLSRRLSSNFFLGMNMKGIYMSMENEKATAYAGDIGMLWRISRGLRLGLNAQNIGTDVKFIEKGYPLPLNIKAGIGYSLGGMNLAVDINKTRGVDSNIHAGVEYLLAQTLALRAGIKNEVASDTHGKKNGMTTGITTGMGLRIGGIQLDYAYIPYGDLDITHRVSLSVKRMPSMSEKPEAKPLPEMLPPPVESETKTTMATATETKSVPQPQQPVQPMPDVVTPPEIISQQKITLPSFNINFDTGRAMISPELYKALNTLVETMLQYPQLRIQIEGHTDNRPIDTKLFSSNYKLSEARAKVVSWYLIQQGIPQERIETKGYADTKPIVSNDTPEGQAKNRRVEIVIIK